MYTGILRKGFFFVVFLFTPSFNLSCQCSANNNKYVHEHFFEVSSDSIKIDLTSYKKCGKYIISDTLDLQYKTLYLPADIRLVMKKGMFKNGCLVGCNTRLDYKDAVFDHVHINGSWLVPRISTSMFRCLDYDNSLKDVLGLASPEISNHVYIENGTYQVTAYDRSARCLSVVDNTKLIIDGTITLTPNNFISYNILHIAGENITVKGNGSIIGDKSKHKGKDGEWGMGISIQGGKCVTITGLTVKDCWGDCVYINRKAQNIVIENCVLDNGRRQGISVISAHNVTIRNCKISNVEGTNPAYAIDVEPNEGDVVSNVKISNVMVSNCKGGFECNGSVKDAVIESISIDNCAIDCIRRWPLRFLHAKSVSVNDCKITGYSKLQVILLDNIEEAVVSNISIDGQRLKRNERIMDVISQEEVNQLRIK